MFEAACTKFSKSVGEGVLQPVPTLDQNTQCKPYQVIIKKNRKWRWQSATYTPSPFTLSQILVDGETDPLENHLKPLSTPTLIYNKIHKLSVKGKLGAKIKVLLDMELDGSDTVDVEAKFENVNKTAIDETQLLGLLSSRKLNVDHAFIKQVREHPRKVLCVVVACYELASNGIVSAKKDIAGEEKFGDEKITKNLVNATEDISIDDDNENSITVPANTVVAYKICELLVKSDRTLELIIENDLSGGFKAIDDVDGAAAESTPSAGCSSSHSSSHLSIDPSIEEMFSTLLSMDACEKKPLVQAVLQMCNFPRDVDSFLVITKQALALVTEEEASGIGLCKTTLLTVLKSKFLCPDQDWATLLQFSGFKFIADGSVEYPKMNSSYLQPLVNVFRALIELTDNQLFAFTQLSQDFAKPLVYLISQTISGKTLDKSDPELSALYNSDGHSALNFAKLLGFETTETGNISHTVHTQALHGALFAIFALFWLKEYEKDLTWKCNV